MHGGRGFAGPAFFIGKDYMMRFAVSHLFLYPYVGNYALVPVLTQQALLIQTPFTEKPRENHMAINFRRICLFLSATLFPVSPEPVEGRLES
jgi:hypothetical protein